MAPLGAPPGALWSLLWGAAARSAHKNLASRFSFGRYLPPRNRKYNYIMPLSPEVREIVQSAARQAGDELKGKLPPISWLPKRNSHAHVYERIKSKMGRSYKDCEDWEAERILDYIQYLVENPC